MTNHLHRRLPAIDTIRPRASSLASKAPVVFSTPFSMPAASRCACGGGCPQCRDGREHRNGLSISQPGDAHEREADAIASKVMRAETRSIPAGPGAGRLKPWTRDSPAQDTAGPVADVFRSSSRPLDESTRAFMESRFGRDFSHVRLHIGSQADHSARELNASAYTAGNRIVIRSDLYAPMTDQGRGLLAHELAHVVQQREHSPMPVIQRQLFPPVPIIISPSVSQPVEVNAVDEREETSLPWYYPPRYTGPITSFFRGDVVMTDIASMVNNVIAFLGARRMHRLNVMDHGNSAGVEIGTDWLASATDVAAHAATLGRLRPLFAGGAFVHMQNCRAGQNQGLICALAAAFGVPVYAGTGLQNPLLGFNFGDYVRCSPGGRFDPDTGRPQTPTPPPSSTTA